MSKVAVISCENVVREFVEGDQQVDVLKGINLSVQPGEKVAIVGPSGSGKTSLLHLLGGLDRPSRGDVSVNGQSLSRLSENELSRLRNKQLGFIYQFHHLLPEFTALENVMMPLLLGNEAQPQAEEKAIALLTSVGLSHRLKHRPAQLSGGERQRTAIARALVTNPLCVLADEPTGNLDQQNAEHIYDIIFNLNKSHGTSFVIATHDMKLANRMDRVIHLVDGLIVDGRGEGTHKNYVDRVLGAGTTFANTP